MFQELAKSKRTTVKHHGVEDAAKKHDKYKAFNMGKLDVTNFEQTSVESRCVQNIVETYKETLEGARKVLYIKRTNIFGEI